MCGDAEPEATIPVFRDAFQPEKISISEHLRGVNMENIDLADGPNTR
jgi:hypothetical protein